MSWDRTYTIITMTPPAQSSSSLAAPSRTFEQKSESPRTFPCSCDFSTIATCAGQTFPESQSSRALSYWSSVPMSKLRTMREAIAELVPDGASVAMGCQMEQMIPFAAGDGIMRQKKSGVTLIGAISDVLFDQMIGAGCATTVIAAWVGNVMMGSAYNFRRAVEVGNPGQASGSEAGEKLRVFNMSNFTVALALQAGAMGVPFLPTRTARGSDLAK